MVDSVQIMKKREKNSITIVIPTLNEQENILPIFRATKKILESTGLKWNILFIDNASNDQTRTLLSKVAEDDERVLLIFNRRNFGTIRSPLHGLFEAPGDAVVIMSADFQDPPDLIATFVKQWIDGKDLVLAVKRTTRDGKMMKTARWVYYKALEKLTTVPTIQNFYGYGLYSREFIELVRAIGNAPILLRSMPGELGYRPQIIHFDQPARVQGKSKNRFWDLVFYAIFSLADRAEFFDKLFMIVGATTAMLSVSVATCYFFIKIFFWESVPVGIAPLIMLVSFLFGVNFFLLGLIYAHNKLMFEHVRKLPLVVELKRFNFENRHG